MKLVSVICVCSHQIAKIKIYFPETHRFRKWTYGCWGEGIVRDFGKVTYTLLYFKWITNKDLLYSTWNSAQCYMPAWMGGVSGENGYMYMYGWVLSLFTWNYHNICNGLWEGNGTPLQYSCLENSMDRGAWWAAVHGVAKSWTWLIDFTFTFHFHALEKEMATHSSVLAWKIPGNPSLVGCRLWDHTESDTT